MIYRTLNGEPLNSDNCIEASDVFDYYVLSIDKDIAEYLINGDDTQHWIENAGVAEILSYVPGKELSLCLTDGRIYKEVVK